LWSDAGANARRYLHQRGLNDDTLQRYRLGYLASDRTEAPEAWGLPPHAGKVWLPHGILIPHLIKKDLWGANIRRYRATPKYLKVRGSRVCLFGADSVRDAELGLLCEGEFDCMLLNQELGDALGAATFGSAANPADLRQWGAHLARLSLILLAYDNDQAGDIAASRLTSGRPVYSFHWPDGKDATDFYLSGGDLWAEVRRNVDFGDIDTWETEWRTTEALMRLFMAPAP
jgi:DNA primase